MTTESGHSATPTNWLVHLATTSEEPASTQDWDGAVRRLARRALANAVTRGRQLDVSTSGASGNALVWSTGKLTGMRLAAFENARAGAEHDSAGSSLIRVGVAIASAALTVGQALARDPAEVRTGIALGVHAALALEHYLGHDISDSAWDSVGTVGQLGSTVAVSRLLGLDPEQARAAIAIAAVQASGSQASRATELAAIQAGRAAATGVEAGLLAKRGIACSQEPIEGRRGLRALTGIRPTPVDLSEHDPDWSWSALVPIEDRVLQTTPAYAYAYALSAPTTRSASSRSSHARATRVLPPERNVT